MNCNNINKILLLAVLILLTPCSASAQQKIEHMGDTKTSSQVLTTKPFQLSDYSGQKLLVAYFATWCPPCIEEAPILIDIQQQFNGDNFTIIGVSIDKSSFLVEKFMNKMGINYPVYMEDQSLKKIFGPIFGLPTIFMVDESGEIVKTFTGKLSQQTLHNEVTEFVGINPLQP